MAGRHAKVARHAKPADRGAIRSTLAVGIACAVGAAAIAAGVAVPVALSADSGTPQSLSDDMAAICSALPAGTCPTAGTTVTATSTVTATETVSSPGPTITVQAPPSYVPGPTVTVTATRTVTASPRPSRTPSPSPTPTPSKSPSPSPSPTPSQSQTQTGFPDATTTGVPAGTALVANSTTVINTDGTVITGAKLGCLTVNADNVVIENSTITGSGFVCVQLNGSGIVLRNDTIAGTNNSSGSVQYAIRDWGSGNSIVGSYVHNCTQCVYSSVTTISDSFIDVDATVAGIHYEAIYDPGGGPGMTIQHSSIVNGHNDQTAAFYAAPDGGQVQGVTINDSYLSGGGYTIYPTGQVGQSVKNVVITGNVVQAGQWGWLYTSPAGMSCSGNVTPAGTPLSC